MPSTLRVTYQASHENIPQYANWKRLLLEFGDRQYRQWLPGGFEGGTGDWFYDATRVFYQIGDYFGPNFNGTPWHQAAVLAVTNTRPYPQDGYRNYVILAGGAQGHFIHPQGLRLHYERTGDSISRQAIELLSNANLANDGASGTFTHRVSSRENCFSLLAHIDARLVGFAPRPRGEELLNTCLKIMGGTSAGESPGGSWFGGASPPAVSQETGITSFQVGLLMEALIYWYEQIAPDPRIPIAIYNALPKFYSWCWRPTQGGFVYDLGTDNSVHPGLNMLSAPAFGWAFKETGDPQYRIWGDELWTQGVCQVYNYTYFTEAPTPCTPNNPNSVNFYNGKFFNEFYRWGLSYIEYREGFTAPTDPTIGLSPASFTFSSQVGSNPPSQSMLITNTGGGVLNWTASDNAAWLATNPSSGTAPGSTSLDINTTGFGVGTHSATLVISAPGATNTPRNVPVILTLSSSSTPYPPSDFTLSFNLGTIAVFGDFASNGSDQWVMTHSADGNIYAGHGDGVGWVNDGVRFTMGFTRISGIPPALNGVDVGGTLESTGPNRKPGSIIADSTVLKVFYASADETPGENWSLTRTAQSNDNGINWVYAGPLSNPAAGSFIQAGPGYDTTGFPSSVDGAYIYGYALNNPDVLSTVRSPLVLGRVLKANVFVGSAYEWFTGTDVNNNALWGSYANRVNVFTNPAATGLHIVPMFNKGLGRFILPLPFDNHSLGVFEAPTPWGPWKTMYYNTFVDTFTKFTYCMPQVWQSTDGRTIWMSYSGWPEYDNLHIIQATITGTATDTTPPAAVTGLTVS